MKQYIREFIKRGLAAASGGPVILAIVYGILGATGVVESLTPAEVSTGVLSVTLMAFIAGGITTVYTVEQLPLISAIVLHGCVLYVDYLIMYLLNRWIPRDGVGIGIFTGIFLAGFAAVWLCIYLIEKKKISKLNRKLHNM